MALSAYLSLKGSKIGAIKGPVIQKGREGRIMVIAAGHEVRNVMAQAANRIVARNHTPFVIRKELDKSTPLLYGVWVANEMLTEWKLEFWAPNIRGVGNSTEVQSYTITLTNARILSIQFVLPNTKDPELIRFSEYEEITFTYEKIEWVWKEGSITAADEWKSVGI